ncbi:Yjr111c-like protein [Venustampulla echinocandica]|uniref:Yjr111c-like protein n=1 Tax=Venustampulla echinocandica TaxID=2656787 RepID=A0A370TYD0_9HELO|nr:Yjr111c-like protein [Venustampulla echinocandica]RDL40535.1 Yjr111c-like protein [Venustampulla echinocandica]
MSLKALPSVITPALLNSIRMQPSLPPHSWYLISATVLTILNRPDEIATVYKHVMEFGPSNIDSMPGYDERLKITRRMREALLKTSAIGGVPKAINAILVLKEVTPIELQDAPNSFSPTSRRTDIYNTPTTEILERGQSFFNKIYGKISKRVISQLDQSGTEDLGLIARLMYSYVLSPSNVLIPVETSYIMIAGLIPQDVNPQLKGHLRGALNGGATEEEVRAVRDISIRMCESLGMAKLGSSIPAGWGWREEVANV